MRNWRQNTKMWEHSKFDDVDVENISEEATKITKIVL
jgi:hypothetical protein